MENNEFNNDNNISKEQKTNNEPVSTYTAINSHKEKVKLGFGKSVIMPFLCGALGTAIVIGTCFGVPTIREKLLPNNSDNKQAIVTNTTRRSTY
ncbi:MAG: hypothetical protein J6D03_07145 [Clostridia bacterium]|nr:hypothetical protein [Clostridia bacterium]